MQCSLLTITTRCCAFASTQRAADSTARPEYCPDDTACGYLADAVGGVIGMSRQR